MQILDESIAYQKGENGENLISMLRLSARWKLDSGDAQGAAAMLQEIHQARVESTKNLYFLDF